MGRKRFIDKKHATTYSLVYRSTEDPDAAPERVLVEAERGVGIGRPDLEAAEEQRAAHLASGRRCGLGGEGCAWGRRVRCLRLQRAACRVAAGGVWPCSAAPPCRLQEPVPLSMQVRSEGGTWVQCFLMQNTCRGQCERRRL